MKTQEVGKPTVFDYLGIMFYLGFLAVMYCGGYVLTAWGLYRLFSL